MVDPMGLAECLHFLREVYAIDCLVTVVFTAIALQAPARQWACRHFAGRRHMHVSCGNSLGVVVGSPQTAYFEHQPQATIPHTSRHCRTLPQSTSL